MKKMGTSILITSLVDEAGSKLAERLANLLSLHYASGKDILEYDLFDRKQMLDKCGVKYLRQREKASLGGMALYENSVIYLPFDLYRHNESIFKKLHPQIYVCFPKSKLGKGDVINEIAFDDRDGYLKDRCDLCVEVKGASAKDVEKLAKLMGEKL